MLDRVAISRSMPRLDPTSLHTPSRMPSNSTLINYPPSTLSMDESFKKLSVFFKKAQNSQHRNPNKFHFYSQSVATNDRPHFKIDKDSLTQNNFLVSGKQLSAKIFLCFLYQLISRHLTTTYAGEGASANARVSNGPSKYKSKEIDE